MGVTNQFKTLSLLPPLVLAGGPEVVDEDIVLLGLVEPLDAPGRHLK
jgi:hypothetical protein